MHSQEDPVQPKKQINQSLLFKKAKMVRLDLKTKHKTYLLSKRSSFLKKDKDRLKIKEQKTIYHANTSQKKAEDNNITHYRLQDKEYDQR